MIKTRAVAALVVIAWVSTSSQGLELPAFLPRKHRWIFGCFNNDQGNDKGSVYPVSKDNTNSQASCRDACKTLWFIYAAVQNGTDCWCSNTFNKHNEAPMSQCQLVTCPGNTKEFCGSKFQSLVLETGYQLEHSSDVNKCWRQEVERPWAIKMYEGTTNTPKFCQSVCGEFLKKFAALYRGNACWCGDNFFRHGLAADGSCNTPCSGDANQYCGGNSHMFVMHSTRKMFEPAVATNKAKNQSSGDTRLSSFTDSYTLLILALMVKLGFM